MGDVAVPVDARWQAQTQRAVQNFPISGQTLEPRLIRALALIKGRAARANASLRSVPQVDRRVAEAIASVAADVAAGEWADQFPVDVFQTGSGTSSNMNMNEVLATLASARLGGDGIVHPNDQVNASQSSNDVFPTAIHVATGEALVHDLKPALEHLAVALRGRERAFRLTVKAGRTHLMDATPITLGQEFGGYATQIEQSIARLDDTMPRLCALPLGGTAVGTGINAPTGFAARVIAGLAEDTGLPLTEARDHVAAQSSRDALVEVSGAVRTLAVAMMKIANDLRWMASGPRAGLGEIVLPALQPGSSIMPGKVNPVIPEVVTQVAVQVLGNDAAVAVAGSQGSFELNVFMPVIARNVLESIRLLAAASRVFADRCIVGIVADEQRCLTNAEASPAVATALAPSLGYGVVAALVAESTASGRSVRELVLEKALVPADELDRLLDVTAMARPPKRG